ncbi:MAG: tautomerase family protein [Gammaproteobacteria bacterium]|nr:tautomerase family protein [Gammaproteobacteria bacterium]
MPVITVSLITGYDTAARTRLSERITDATTSVIRAPSDLVTVMINEVAADNYMRGRTARSPGPAHADQSKLVQDYLNAMERRDLDAAMKLQAPGFTMVFPGGEEFTSLDQLIAWASQRYNSISKTYETFDCCPTDGGATVYCFGTLQGVWLDGSKFSGVRFIDRFTVVDDLLTSQQVWNDLRVE